MEDAPSLRIGDVLAEKYEILGLLGSGAMGLVYSARHTVLNRKVALKTLRAEIAQDRELVGRFQQEARAASALGHANIVQIYDAGIAGGMHYMVMECLEGVSLHECLEQEPLLDPMRAAFIMDQVLSALEIAHSRGIVHRDLKPENIFLARTESGEELVKLLDFGISKVLEQAEEGIAGVDSLTRATRLGVVMGTPLYMSPEQARGATDIDHRADLWAAACVLYEMLCGCTPYDGENYNQVLVSILEGDFKAPRLVRPAISTALEDVILRGKAQKREARYPNAQSMRAALNRAVAGGAQPTVSTRESPQPPEPAQLNEEDKKLLSALDALTDRAAVAETMTPVPDSHTLDAYSLVSAEPAIDESKPAPTDLAADPFAPPAAHSENMVIELAQPQAVGPSAATRRAHVGAAGAASTLPARSSTLASRRSSRSLGSVLAVLIGVGLLGTGGAAAYRYARLGYLLSPPPPAPTNIAFSITPTDAAILVGDEPLVTRPFEATVGTEYVFTFRARGRLAARRTVIAAPDMQPMTVRLPLGIAPVDPALARHYKVADDAARQPRASRFDEVESALVKLDRYGRCLILLKDDVTSGADAYLKFASARVSAKSMPIVLPVPPMAFSECRQLVESTRSMQPALSICDAAAKDFVAVLDELVPLATAMSSYYFGDAWKRDHLRRGKAEHKTLTRLFRKALAEQNALVQSLWTERRAWQQAELASIAEAEGERAHWHARRVVLASHDWALAEAGEATSDVRSQLRSQLEAAVAEARKHAASNAEDQSQLVGAEEYLASVDAVLAQSGADTLVWHNNSVELFNKIVLSAAAHEN